MEFHRTSNFPLKVPWNSMKLPWKFWTTLEQHLWFHGIPWNFVQIQSSVEFPLKFHGIPWNSMELFWSSMEFHRISGNLNKWYLKESYFLILLLFDWWLYVICLKSQKRYVLHRFQYRNSYFEHPGRDSYFINYILALVNSCHTRARSLNWLQSNHYICMPFTELIRCFQRMVWGTP